MQLYHWLSNALSRYSCGDIIVMAESVAAARACAALHASVWIKENMPYWYDDKGELLPENKEEHDRWFAKLTHDLAMEPTIVGSNSTIFIKGSE